MKNEIEEVISLWKKDISARLKRKQPLPDFDQLNRLASLFAPGEHYYFIFGFFDMQMEYVHPRIQQILGIEPEDWSERKFLEIQTPESLEQTRKKEETVGRFFYGHIPPEDIPNYKASYFVTVKDYFGREKRILHQSTAITVSSEQKIERVFCIHTDVSHLKMLKDDTISFISLSDKPSYYNVDPLVGKFTDAQSSLEEESEINFSEREKQILTYISRGETARQIAERLELKENTVRTHRQKILEKANCHNSTELVTKCLVRGII